MLHRLVRNFVLSIPGFAVVRLATLPIPIAVAMWAQEEHIGLLHWLALPFWIAGIATFLLMDYAYWWWHWANHMIPVFWRFHNVHHTDLDLDVSTAARFHFGEMIFSIGFLSLAVTVFGISPVMLVAFFIALEAATLFHHSNWRLPIRLERILNLIVVTPRMHGIHHSIVQRETNSNWGTIFCWWDQLHRTLRRDVPQDAITIGVAAYRDEHELTLGKLLTLPFHKQRPWRLPNGELPDRTIQPADRLAE
jgi:sterol desaturase/sphingolipid hydroxylase (fatty acid hydroxylase superfamily)